MSKKTYIIFNIAIGLLEGAVLSLVILRLLPLWGVNIPVWGLILVVVALVAVGDCLFFGQCDVGGWTDIIQVAAGDYHTVGLKSDGAVVTVGSNSSGKCDVGGWDRN